MEQFSDMDQFPVFYDHRILDDAERWFSKGCPDVTPMFVRNKVDVTLINEASMSLTAFSEHFVLQDGEELFLENAEGWVDKYPLTLNPATWSLKDFSAENEGATLLNLEYLCKIDPTLPGKISPHIDAQHSAIFQPVASSENNNYPDANMPKELFIGSDHASRLQREMAERLGYRFTSLVIPLDRITTLYPSLEGVKSWYVLPS